jgi:hypothetical protein
MSSALPPRADGGLAAPNIARTERYGKFDERPLCAKTGPSSNVAFDPTRTSAPLDLCRQNAHLLSLIRDGSIATLASKYRFFESRHFPLIGRPIRTDLLFLRF